MSKNITRPATAVDGPAIYALCLAAGMWDIEGLDWTHVGAGWLVTEDTRGLTGCIQIYMGVPITRFEMLFVHPRCTGRYKAMIVKQLCEEACRLAGALGAQAVNIVIPDHFTSWKKVVERRRCVPWFHGTSYLRSCT